MNKDSQLITEAYRQINQSKVGNHNVSRITRKVEQFLGDVIEDPDNIEDATEQCWTLCIDAAHDLGLEGDHAIYAARKACTELGYPKKEELEKIDVGAPGSALEQHANMMTEEELEIFISSGHDLDAVKAYRNKNKPVKESSDIISIKAYNFRGYDIEIFHLPEEGYIAYINGVPKAVTKKTNYTNCISTTNMLVNQQIIQKQH